jgi:Fe-S-cluster containining protein
VLIYHETVLEQRYLDLVATVDAEFARNRSLHGDRIQCRPGCSDCCHQLFQITELEAAYISAAVQLLPAERREALQTRARTYVEARRKLVTAGGEPESWGHLPPAGTRLACPALEDGICSLYEFRPLICHKFGMPLYNPEKPGRILACELNFKNGEEIHDSELIRIHTAMHGEWKQIKAEYREAGGPRDPEPVTVARAILENFGAPELTS